MKNKGLKIAFLVITQICIVAGFAMIWYCFGGFALIAGQIPNEGGSEGLAFGLSTFFIQIFLIVGGLLFALLFLIQLIGDIGCIVQIASKRREFRRGFLITSIAPALLLVIMYVVAAILSFEILPLAMIALIIIAVIEIVMFVLGIICAAKIRKKPVEEHAAEEALPEVEEEKSDTAE